MGEVGADARDVAEGGRHRLDEPVLGPDPPFLTRPEPDVELVVVGPIGVGAVIGRSRLRDHHPHLREPEHPLTDLVDVGTRGFERDPDRQLDPQPQVALVQLGQELLAQQGECEQRYGQESRRAEDGRERVTHAPGEGPCVGPPQPTQQGALPIRRGPPKQEARQHRDEGEGQEERADHGQGDGHRHGPEQLSLDALEREDGHVHRHDDQDREGEGPCDFHRRVLHLAHHPVPGHPALAQVPHDVLGHDHGAVHDDPEVDGAERKEIGRDAP